MWTEKEKARMRRRQIYFCESIRAREAAHTVNVSTLIAKKKMSRCTNATSTPSFQATKEKNNAKTHTPPTRTRTPLK